MKSGWRCGNGVCAAPHREKELPDDGLTAIPAECIDCIATSSLSPPNDECPLLLHAPPPSSPTALKHPFLSSSPTFGSPMGRHVEPKK